jgi:hypothetical protein
VYEKGKTLGPLPPQKNNSRNKSKENYIMRILNYISVLNIIELI